MHNVEYQSHCKCDCHVGQSNIKAYFALAWLTELNVM